MIIDCYNNNDDGGVDEFLERISNGEDTTSLNIAIPCDNTHGVISKVDPSSFLRISTEQIISYSVEKDGIYENIEWLDQYSENMNTVRRKRIMSKEAFIEAFNTYIKNENN